MLRHNVFIAKKPLFCHFLPLFGQHFLKYCLNQKFEKTKQLTKKKKKKKKKNVFPDSQAI